MKWEDYLEEAKKRNSEVNKAIDEVDELYNLIETIIERRHELGLSQRELARMVGLPHSSVARIETGKVSPNIETVIKIIKPLGLKITITSI